MAAGVGKTYRMLQEGRQAQERGTRRRDRLPRAARPAGDGRARRGSRGRAAVCARRTAGSSSTRWTSTPSSRASPSSRSSTSSRTRTRPACATRSATRTSTRSSTPGIDVISTVNIQHLESLNDAIFELTGVRVRETFPDRILDEADEVVLVDLSPEELQERLRAGKVYPQERAEVALENFFRQENLAALRELVLREVAEDVEARRQPASARAAQPAGRRRAHPRADRATAEVAADPSPRLALVAAARRRDRRALGAPGPTRADRGGGDAARGSSPAREHPRHPFPRGGRRRSRRDGSHASPRSAARPTSSSARPTSGGGGDPPRLAALADGARAAGHRHPRHRRPAPSEEARPNERGQLSAAHGSRDRPAASESSSRSPAASSTRSSSTRRSGSRGPRTRRSCPPT